MPWRQVDAMKEGFQFIRDARQRLVTFTELCATTNARSANRALRQLPAFVRASSPR